MELLKKIMLLVLLMFVLIPLSNVMAERVNVIEGITPSYSGTKLVNEENAWDGDFDTYASYNSKDWSPTYTFKLPEKTTVDAFVLDAYIAYIKPYNTIRLRVRQENGKITDIGSHGYESTSVPRRDSTVHVLKTPIPDVVEVILDIAKSYSDIDYRVYEAQVFATKLTSNPEPEKFVISGLKPTFNPPDTVTLSWKAINSDFFRAYRVYQDGKLLGSTNGNEYSISGLTLGQSYNFRVTPIDTFDVEYGGSPLAYTPPLPQNPKLKTGDLKWSEVNLSWNQIPGAKGIKLYRNGEHIASPSYTAVQYADRTVQPETDYVYYLQFMDQYGRDLKSDEVNVRTPAKPVNTDPPKAPANFKASMAPNMRDIVLTWNKGAEVDLTGYNLYLSMDGEKYTALGKMLKTPGYTYSDAQEEKKYYFRLEAINEAEVVSEPSETFITAPKRSTDSEQEQTPDYLLVTWEETVGAVGYQIYLNGKLVGEVGPDVRSYKITKEMGYKPGQLNNQTSVKAKFADGSTGGGGSSGGGPNVDFGFGGSDIWKNAVTIVKQIGPYALLGLALLLVPYLFRLLRVAVTKFRERTGS